MNASAHAYPMELIRSDNRVTRQSPCAHCNSDHGCLRFDSGDSFCKKIGTPEQWTDKLQGGYLHKAGHAKKRLVVVAKPEPEKADPVTLDRVNRAILRLCPVSDEDRAYLCNAGYARDFVGEIGTLPPQVQQKPIIDALVGKFGYDLLQRHVPGFVVQDGDLRLNGAGMLVAVADVAGQVVGFQVRYGPGDYRWLSGGAGPSSGAPAAVVRPREQRDSRIYVVESPKTAYLMAERLGAVVIGLGGHSNYRRAIPALTTLVDDEGAGLVIIAFDHDEKPETVEAVERSRQAFAQEAVQVGCAVRLARWDHTDGKGPDDLLAKGGSFTMEVYRPTPDARAAEHKRVRDLYERQRQMFDAITAVAQNRWWTPDPKTGKRKYVVPPTTRIVAINTMLVTNRAPGVDYGDGPRYVTASRVRIADMSGVSVGTVSHEWASLAEHGILSKHLERHGIDDCETQFAPGVLPGPRARLDEAKHRQQARARRCRHCGSTALKVECRVTCTNCGAIEEHIARRRQGEMGQNAVAGKDERDEEHPADLPATSVTGHDSGPSAKFAPPISSYCAKFAPPPALAMVKEDVSPAGTRSGAGTAQNTPDAHDDKQVGVVPDVPPSDRTPWRLVI